MSVSPPSILWVGGTSALARSFLNKYYGEQFMLAGLEERLPIWAPAMTPYLQMDLTQPVHVPSGILNNIQILIISVRASFVAKERGDHEALLVGIESLLHQFQGKFVLHISSVAAVDQLQTQIGQDEDHKVPPLSEYKGGYDRFKRRSEDLITKVCSAQNIGFTHLRIGAIFSDSYECIQSSTLAFQSRIGTYLPTLIDCNSGRNVARAICLILERIDLGSAESDVNKTYMKQVYNYTRPTDDPVPYGEHLKEFQAAYNMAYFISLPPALVIALFWIFHWLVWNTPLHCRSPACVSLDYLLQVMIREHTFDNSRFRADFPEIGKMEESIAECFRRRKRTLRQVPDLSDLYAASS